MVSREAQREHRLLLQRASYLDRGYLFECDARGKQVLQACALAMRDLAALHEADPSMADDPERCKPAWAAGRLGRDIRIVVMRANNPRRSAEVREQARAEYEGLFTRMNEHLAQARDAAVPDWARQERTQMLSWRLLQNRAELVDQAAYLLRQVAEGPGFLPHPSPMVARVLDLAGQVQRLSYELNPPAPSARRDRT